MPNYKHYNYNQTSMVVISFEDQIQPGTFEHAIHFLISERLDLSVFEPKYKNDTGGRPAYDPAILLKIILFAYSKRSEEHTSELQSRPHLVCRLLLEKKKKKKKKQ